MLFLVGSGFVTKHGQVFTGTPTANPHESRRHRALKQGEGIGAVGEISEAALLDIGDFPRLREGELNYFLTTKEVEIVVISEGCTDL